MQTRHQSSIFDYSMSSQRLVVALQITSNEAARVVSCTFDGRNFQNSTVFDEAATIDGVFAGDIAKAFCDCIAGLAYESQVIALPDIRIETEGVTLSDLTIITKQGLSGTLDVALRFRQFVGGFSPLFTAQTGFGSNLDDHTSRLSAVVLSDLAMPILNLCEALDEPLNDAGPSFARFAQTLARHSHEVKLQIELLKRFAARSETGSTAPNRQQSFGHGALNIEKAYELGLLGKAHFAA
ncbi:hypothetical protein [Yoonia sediminilitoris]|uniref:Uncharacterized protein n=1 Tax=Yoonia sediminilitoris TaxID=1286148 RepID=A0A2T6K9V1_9RHOB|nr:hypothetical protein [Yoonia sediminilitoris]PUB11582.1 hypothetical protein C8N45_113101 [Yoonia sediminilitoris]RCW91782.1 hypothetical protein DFP92_113101 [Yoonia sediminilitoris]